MTLVTVIAMAIGLGMDAFAVSIVAGAQQQRLTFRPVFRLSFHFGLFQFLMPIIGWFAGRQIASLIRAWDHWVAFGLLLIIGGKMIWDSFSDDDEALQGRDMTRKGSMVMLSIATSIDALAVGLSLAFLDEGIWFTSVIIGLVAAAMTIVGMVFGRSLGRRFRLCMARLGGFILIGIGVKILLQDLLG